MNKENKRVLHVLGHLRRGGAEIFLFNMFREVEKSGIVFDVMTRGENLPEVAEEIRMRGGKVIETPGFPKHIRKNYRCMKRFFKEHGTEYRAIHVHANSLLYLLPLRLAKKYGIPIRILHSHNTHPEKSLYKGLHYLNRARLGRLATKRVACSAAAGRWMFGKKPYEQVRNAIDVSKFVYNEQVREKLRAQYRVSDVPVIGTVGRLEQQKNHFFLLDVFCDVRKRTDAVLFIIGEGSLEEKLKLYAKEKGVEASVVFLKNIANVNDYLQMMDVFVLPSLYEGLGISVIEAQTAGLQVVISDRVPEEAVLISENIRRMKLGAAEEWAEVITELGKRPQDTRKSWDKTVTECGYDSATEAKKLVKLYEL